MAKKVFVSGCYDLLHSGHVEFFKEAAAFGDLYVGIGSDATIMEYKHHKTVYSEQERLFMVKSIRYVKDAFINAGHGIMDFVPTVELLRPDVFVVNEDGSTDEKRRFCESLGIEYVVLKRKEETMKHRLFQKKATEKDIRFILNDILTVGNMGKQNVFWKARFNKDKDNYSLGKAYRSQLHRILTLIPYGPDEIICHTLWYGLYKLHLVKEIED